jgi:hypothetical protein
MAPGTQHVKILIGHLNEITIETSASKIFVGSRVSFHLGQGSERKGTIPSHWFVRSAGADPG